jgi:hypothetical protein
MEVFPPARTASFSNMLPIPLTAFSPQPGATADVRNFPSKFQIWAEMRACEQMPIGQQGSGLWRSSAVCSLIV